MINIMDSIELKSPLKYNPFHSLKSLVAVEDLRPFEPIQQASKPENKTTSDTQQEDQIFLEAMEGVTPLEKDHFAVNNIEVNLTARPKYIPENEALSQLVKLVDHGVGFIVSDTPEYIEGTGCNVHQDFARRLHQGDYSIQDHIDLHGLNVESAKGVFESFLKASVNAGKRAVLIIHGRGLSSPGDSVLKNKVREWLGCIFFIFLQ